MKKQYLTYTLVLFVLPLSLLAKPNLNYYINTGIAKPVATSDFRKTYRSGVHLNVGMGKPIANRLEGLFNLSFNQLTFDGLGFKTTLEKENTDSLVINGGPCNVLNMMVGVKYKFSAMKDAKTISYVSIQGGMQQRKTKRIDVFDPNADFDTPVPALNLTHGVLNVGIGGEMFIENTTLFAELGLDIAFEKEEKNMIVAFRFGVKI